jgi:hypothetical protein
MFFRDLLEPGPSECFAVFRLLIIKPRPLTGVLSPNNGAWRDDRFALSCYRCVDLDDAITFEGGGSERGFSNPPNVGDGGVFVSHKRERFFFPLIYQITLLRIASFPKLFNRN